jgi:pectin methylesterase-like acyl-CoA thioesterase
VCSEFINQLSKSQNNLRKEQRHDDNTSRCNGNGNFKAIDTTISVVLLMSSKRHVIHIMSGIYSELVMVEKPNITFMGDDMCKTLILGSCYNTNGHNTHDTTIVSKCIPPRW